MYKKITKTPLDTIIELVEQWGLNKGFLAAKIGMPRGTFNNKINPAMTAYNFSDDELARLQAVFVEMANDILKSIKN